MKYNELEDYLVDLFNKDKDEEGNIVPEVFDIAASPETENEYIDTDISKPVVFCSYDNSDYMTSESTDEVFQEDVIKIGFEIRARKRRGESGIFAIFDRIKKVVLGHKVAGYDKFQLVLLTPIVPKKDEPSMNGWRYYMQFTTTTHVCEDQPEEQAYNLQTFDFVNKQ